ncbi:MAG: sugar-binding protein, partial [Dysgonamonadaceae bacterium]|nr:sugar-binding protein [Dysgonamonadaceae bacterium]
MKKIILATVKYFSILCICNSVHAIDIPFMNTPPIIDGVITKAEWSQAQHGKLNIINPRNTPDRELQNSTDVYVGYNKEYLFASFVCHEKDMTKLSASILALEARDTNIWTDDCVEILLDPLASGTESYHFIINSNGIFYDAFNGDASWDSNMKVAAKKYEDNWVVEVAIPFSDFNYTPIGTEQWRGNFCREQKLHNENSSIFAAQSFSDPASFGPLAFLKPEKSESENVHLSIDQLWNTDSPSVKVLINNEGEAKQNFKIAVSNTVNGKLFFDASENIDAAPQKTTEIAIPYKTSSDEQNVMLTVTNLNNNNILYSNQFLLAATSKDTGISTKTWNIEDPLYSELFTNESLPLGKEGALSWMHLGNYGKMRTIAKQYGLSYRYEDAFKYFAENKLRAFTNPFRDPKVYPADLQVPLSKKYGMGNVVFADARLYSKDKIPFGLNNTQPWPVDPVAISAANQAIKESLENHRDIVWGGALGDETERRIFKIGIELFNKYTEEDYPYIHQADREIKKQYGHDKYGIPLDEHDQNPFRWIAYRRWVNQKLVEMHTKLYKTVKDIAPEVKVVGNDPIAFHHPFNYREQKCDIMTHQLYPRRNSNRARFGFLTKLNVDLSANMEFWPCVHVENYASNLNHTEVLELMSQVIRNGGTGFHFYPVDVVNGRAGSNCLSVENYAAPDRWKLQMALVKELGNIKKLAFPNPDCAILFATDTHSSLPYGSETFEVESAYTFLGPVARSYFTFVDDYWVEETPEQLAKYKALYVPSGKYMRSEVASNLLEYVEKGGTLISGDPEIFSFCSDGTSLKQMSEKLFGIAVKGDKEASHINYGELTLPVLSKSYT